MCFNAGNGQACAAGLDQLSSYLAARGTPSHPRDLAAHDAIVFSGSPRGRLWRFGQHKTFTVEVRGRFTANSLELVCASCVAGLGLAWLPLPIAHEHLRTNRLVEVLSDFAAPPAPLSLLYPSNRQLSPAVRAFIDFIAKHPTRGVAAGPIAAPGLRAVALRQEPGEMELSFCHYLAAFSKLATNSSCVTALRGSFPRSR